MQFSPREAVVMGSTEPEAGNTLSKWANIKYWGYDLNEPGNYTITALLNMGAWEIKPKLPRRFWP